MASTDAGQCAYCLPRIVLALTALSAANPSPSRADVVPALDPHRSGKAELGQGIRTALVAVAADELGVDPALVDIEGPASWCHRTS
jgi:xanthine dehydrogenase iron-sulfur cluster and FAD-binding subunit A